MSSLLLQNLPLRRAAELGGRPVSSPQARLGHAALAGRLVELSEGQGTACLSFLCSLVLEAQALGDPVAWVESGETIFFPPDMAANGVDLASLIVVRAPGIRNVLRGAHHLLHSGAFGMVILDARGQTIPQGILGRFAHLAERHRTTLVFLTHGGAEPGLGSMVSLRLKARLRRVRPGVFRCELDVLKDKRFGPCLHSALVYHAPPGLR